MSCIIQRVNSLKARQNLYELLEFIETLSIDEQLYWQIATNSDENQIEVMWKKNNLKCPWRIRCKGSKNWTELHKDQLVGELDNWDADIGQLEKSIGVSVMTQAVFADQIVQGACQLFGSEAVQAGIQDARLFLDSIAETIKEQTKQIEKHKRLAKLELVSNSDIIE